MPNSQNGGIKLALYLIFGGGFSLYTGLKRIRQLREIEDTPRCEIRSAPQGLVEIEGYALPFQESYKNRDGKLVAYREFKIERKVSSGKNSNWEVVYQETEGANFVVSDCTGLVLVDITGGELLIDETIIRWAKIPPEDRDALILRYGSKAAGLPRGPVGFFSFSHEYRVKERNLLVGAPVCVRGSFKTEKTLPPYVINPLHLRFLEKIANLKKQPGGRVKAFDFNGDGRVDDQELAKGSEKILYQSKDAIQSDDKPEPVALQGAFHYDSVHGLIVGDSFQQQLTRKLSKWNPVRIFGGVAMIAAGVGLLVAQFDRH